MKKFLLISLCALLFYPVLMVAAYFANNMYAVSLRSMFGDVVHPSDSLVLVKDWSVANCGMASNQCCYTYVEFRSIPRPIEYVEKWYAKLMGAPDLRKTREFMLFHVDEEWRAQPMHAFFDRKYDELFSRKRKNEAVYGIAYVESGYSAGLDFRCH
jgi:hypothetical protein